MTRQEASILITRFLDGTTTVEEEAVLARYLRDARDLPDEWRAYREMFAYFDSGMPLGELPEFDGSATNADAQNMTSDSEVCNQQASHRHKLYRMAGWVVAAAAAVALMVVMHRPFSMEPSVPANNIMYSQVAEPKDSAIQEQMPEAELEHRHENKFRKQDNSHRKAKTRKEDAGQRILRHRYDVAPPKRYFATATEQVADSLLMESDRLVAEQKVLVEEQEKLYEDVQELEKIIQETIRLVDDARNELIANGDFEDYDDSM